MERSAQQAMHRPVLCRPMTAGSIAHKTFVGPLIGRWVARTGSWPLLAALYLIAAGFYLWAYGHNPSRPHSAGNPGWIVWFDQSWYYKAAIAWAHGNLDPTQHWYLPGYALLAAPFALLTSLHPFLVPDLLALLISVWLFGRLTAEVAPELPRASLTGSALFVACSVLMPTMLNVWVVPMSTSASTPIVYAGLLSALCYCRTGRPILVFLAALSCCAVAGFRPSDAIAPTIAAAAGIGWSLLVRSRGVRPILWAVAAAIAGALTAAVPLGGAYYALYGDTQSGYVWLSSALGFEWRLLPLRWVTLVLDPRPLLPEGEGLIHRFPWIVPGLAGCSAAILIPPPRSSRLAAAVLAAAAALHVAIYLCYRDLHPGGLFQFSNFHYFKWALPILALFAWRFAWALVTGPRRWQAACAGLLPLVILLPWRVEIRPYDDAATFRPTFSGDVLSFNADLSDLHNVLLVGANRDAGSIYGAGHSLLLDGHDWGFVDFRTYPEPGGFILVPLRPMGSGEARLKLLAGSGVFRRDVAPVYARQTITFGVPCFFNPERAACAPTELIAPVAIPSGGIAFDGSDVPYISTGWSFVQNESRWTDGDLVAVRFRLPPADIGVPLRLAMQASAFYPPGAPPLRVRLRLNNVEVAKWIFRNSDRVDVTAAIPPGLVAANGTASLALHIDNPRHPHDFDPNSSDTRQVGLLVHTLQVGASAAPVRGMTSAVP